MFKVNFFVLVGILTTLVSITFAQHPTQNIKNVAKIVSSSTFIERSRLPNPYNYLLTQTLMTKGVEKYYQRTPIIHPIYSELDKNNNIYSRTILMLLDNNKDRNAPALAQRQNETIVAELAFITINFKALPNKLKRDILNTNTPFGQLLVTHHIKSVSKGRKYFFLRCNKELSLLIHCSLNNKQYGRTHLLVREDNNKWLARVTEILS